MTERNEHHSARHNDDDELAQTVTLLARTQEIENQHPSWFGKREHEVEGKR
jgi:hypothetical protein